MSRDVDLNVSFGDFPGGPVAKIFFAMQGMPV